jgi:hypothetical protein
MLIFNGCVRPVTYTEYENDKIKIMLKNDKKQTYTFIGDKYIYTFTPEESKKFTYLLELIHESKSWKFSNTIKIDTYNVNRYSSHISIEIEPSEKQLKRWMKLYPNYIEDFEKGFQKRADYVHNIHDFNNIKGMTFGYRSVWFSKSYYFRFDFHDIKISNSDEEILNKFKDYEMKDSIDIDTKGVVKVDKLQTEIKKGILAAVLIPAIAALGIVAFVISAPFLAVEKLQKD